ncbi:hypothetical protein, conserved [Trypanosoma vivax Y486]|uniref:Uncharacterized protein n=1 Tax=Trypanosoma vivax (strain Y486) TaxID=1055687 RepID=F9WSK4_TRYVY|nr:hypothetical protein, conserved [Trypanosoma vivax Y486]|eukprot:CCD20543.1 hypothetical protein, conserved [Trypanosoma vivax Y486]
MAGPPTSKRKQHGKDTHAANETHAHESEGGQQEKEKRKDCDQTTHARARKDAARHEEHEAARVRYKRRTCCREEQQAARIGRVDKKHEQQPGRQRKKEEGGHQRRPEQTPQRQTTEHDGTRLREQKDSKHSPGAPRKETTKHKKKDRETTTKKCRRGDQRTHAQRDKNTYRTCEETQGHRRKARKEHDTIAQASDKHMTNTQKKQHRKHRQRKRTGVRAA